MGLILNEYYEYKDKYKEYIPLEVYKVLETDKHNRAEMLEPTQEDRDKYFVEGLEELSSAVFNLLHSGRGYYIINYAHDFSVNRKAAGFKTKEDIVHYAIWVIEDFLNSKNGRVKHLDELKENSVGKSNDEMMKDMMKEEELMKELREITFNMKTPEDMQKRLSLIEELEEYKTLSHHLLDSFAFYQIIDDVYTALENIPNVHTFNIPPAPMEQNFWDSSMV